MAYSHSASGTTVGNIRETPLADGDGKWVEFAMRRNDGGEDELYGVDGDYLPEP